MTAGMECDTVYDASYADGTSISDIRKRDRAGQLVLLGAKSSDASDEFALAAIGDYDKVFAESADAENADTTENRGTFWYLTTKAMGFAPVEHVSTHSCDTATEDGRQRLCWHLSGSGGYRAGESIALNTNTVWRSNGTRL